MPDEGAVWEHRLGSPIPVHIDACDASLDEVRLRGSFNVPLAENEQRLLVDEVKRVLKPKGRLLVRILAGDKTHPSPVCLAPLHPSATFPPRMTSWN